MKFLIYAHFPTEAGNTMVKDPKFAQNLENYLNTLKPEAAYFTEYGGERTIVMAVNMPNDNMMPTIAEPLFQLGARVEFKPTMVLADLKEGIRKAIEALPK